MTDNLELLREVMRACNYDLGLMQNVVIACKSRSTAGPEVQDVLLRVKAVIESMEATSTSVQDLVQRIAVAEPINPKRF